MNKLAKLYDLQQQKAELAKQTKALDAEIKTLQHGFGEGLHSDGEYVVDVKPRVRFDAATAKKALNENIYNAILESKPSARLAKKMLTGYEYEECQKQVGVIATVKKTTDV